VSISVKIKGTISCDEWGCDAKTEVDVTITEELDIGGVPCTKDILNYDFPEGWGFWIGHRCPEHKR